MAEMDEVEEDPLATEIAEAELNARPDYEPGQKVWVQDGEGTSHPGIYVHRYGSIYWFGNGPSAVVLHPQGHKSEVVSIERITPRD